MLCSILVGTPLILPLSSAHAPVDNAHRDRDSACVCFERERERDREKSTRLFLLATEIILAVSGLAAACCRPTGHDLPTTRALSEKTCGETAKALLHVLIVRALARARVRIILYFYILLLSYTRHTPPFPLTAHTLRRGVLRVQINE